MIDGKSVRKKLIGSNDERAVSPVIGVILMVAITVILAAVIAAFVLDMGSPSSNAPTATYEWSQEEPATGEYVASVQHTGGDKLDNGELKVVVEANSVETSLNSEWGNGEATAGSTLTIGHSNQGADITDDSLSTGDTVQIVWESNDGSSSSVLTDYTLN